MGELTLPPSTSSPMIRQAAVLIMFFWGVPLVAMIRDVIEYAGRSGDGLWREFGIWRARCRDIWLMRAYIDQEEKTEVLKEGEMRDAG